MKTLQIETKYLQVTLLKDGKPVSHPVFIKKGILKQVWEDYVIPFLALIGGISVMIQIGKWMVG